jgi:hypothetical protein
MSASGRDRVQPEFPGRSDPAAWRATASLSTVPVQLAVWGFLSLLALSFLYVVADLYRNATFATVCGGSRIGRIETRAPRAETKAADAHVTFCIVDVFFFSTYRTYRTY